MVGFFSTAFPRHLTPALSKGEGEIQNTTVLFFRFVTFWFPLHYILEKDS